jgi:phosphoribosylanthranilate isomerase
MRTRVKICGITRIQDALAAAEAGADAIGLVFYAGSPRCVRIPDAVKIVAALPPLLTVVGLFVNAAPTEVHEVLASVPLDLLQFHGEETPAQCRGHGRRYIKAIRMREGVDVQAQARIYDDAAALLLDAYVADVHGGTGQRFDWARVPRDVGKPLILAGGLTPENVAEAVAVVQPYAVDVSGGVEKSKGVKDADRIAAFVHNVTNKVLL